MSSHLTVRQTLDLLARLKAGATAHAQARQEAEAEHQRRRIRDQRRFEDMLEEDRLRAARELEQVEAHHQGRLKTLQTRFELRADRIQRFEQTYHKTALERIEEEEGRCKYVVQKGELETERTRSRELAENDAAWHDFKSALHRNQEAFTHLEEETYRAFGSFPGFRQTLLREARLAERDPSLDQHQLFQELETLREQMARVLDRFRQLPVSALFRLCPAWLLAILLALGHGGVWAAREMIGWPGLTLPVAAGSMTATWLLLGVLYLLGRRKAKPLAIDLADGLGRAQRLHDLALAKADDHHKAEAARIEAEAKQRLEDLARQWDEAVAEATRRRTSWPDLAREKASLVATHNATHVEHQKAEEADRHQKALAEARATAQLRRQQLVSGHDASLTRLDSDHRARLEDMDKRWQSETQPILDQLEQSEREACGCFPDWSEATWDSWSPPGHFSHAALLGRLRVERVGFLSDLGGGEAMALPGSGPVRAPLLLRLPEEGSVLLETEGAGGEEARASLNNMILRLLSQAPAGRVQFTLIDPVRLGESFAAIMHLADYEENLINHRIWTQPAEIEQRLADLNEQMEKVIQMYLRNEYRTITEYNEKAGAIAEKYHFLVVADFPVNFSDTAIRRLENIAASGARCGVYTLVHWDKRQALPPHVVLDELQRHSIRIIGAESGFRLFGQPTPGVKLELELPPAPERATDFLRRAGQAGSQAGQVEVPFAHVAPKPSQLWSLTTTEELRVPIGRTGATKLQCLALGKGTRQHALIAGKTGSGKSTLFHVLITNLALWASPDEVEFYLVDFKKGVEFKCYASGRLPHARVIAIESDREFGLSVLQRVDEELRRRGDLFRELGVQDLAGFKRTRPDQPMPRSLLIIDEFQELFVEEDRVGQEAAVLLDRIVRQGRAFGIHVLLGSQTLGGAYTLARTTIGQMVIRIALQCNEADAYLIMDDNNPAPRLLTRPGEGIYNDMAGATEGNSPFQAVWLSDEERDQQLRIVRAQAEKGSRPCPAPFVFEGNAPADLAENSLLDELLLHPPATPPAAARVWLGSPNRIKGPTEAAFRRQAGQHLLMVGQRHEAILSLFTCSLFSLAAQHRPGTVRFVWCDSTAPGSPERAYLDQVLQAVPHEVELVRSGDLEEAFQRLGQEFKQRSEAEAGAQAAMPVFIFVAGLQHFKKLRMEEDFGFGMGEEGAGPKSSALFQELVQGGSSLGLHLVVSCDTYNNVNRFLGRKALTEFEMRVLFQMSANDSASLIDNTKAGSLGLHRALFYNEHEGHLETFRPYAMPSPAWLQEAGLKLGQSTQPSSS